LNKIFLPFEEAREYVRKLKLKGVKEWNEFTKSDKFPDFLPTRPEKTYKDEWKGTTEWLGYAGRIPNLPMNTEIISIDSLVPGEHTLTLRPEGRVSGCNTAGIAAWDGSI